MKEKDTMEDQVSVEEKIRRLITDLNDPSIDIRHQAVKSSRRNWQTRN